MALIQLEDVCKTFGAGESAVRALDHVSLELHPSESVAIVGPSGSGKSTLLSIMGLALAPDKGTVTVGEQTAAGWSDAQRCRFRNRTFGYMFQDFALLEDESVFENIRLPLLYARMPRREHRTHVEWVAEQLGISEKLRMPAEKLSGGQKQRVAVARAMVYDQPIVLADEPTGQLDAQNREHVVNALLELARKEGRLVVIVTHDLEVASHCDRVIQLHDGRVVAE